MECLSFKAASLNEVQLQAQRPEIFRKLLSLGLAGTGAGVMGRTLVELLNGREAKPMPFVSPGPSVLPMPVLAEAPEPDPAKRMGRRLKTADWATELSKRWTGLVSKVPVIGTGLNTLEQSATGADKAWWNMPMAAAVGGGSLAGGWALSDAMLDKNRKQNVDEDLEQAKQRYQQALMNDSAANVKTAADAKLDKLYDAFEKAASDPSHYASGLNPMSWPGVLQTFGIPAGDIGNGAMGSYLTALGTLTGGAGYAGYRWAKSRGQGALMDKAMKERARRLWGTQSQPLEAVGVPVQKEEAALAA